MRPRQRTFSRISFSFSTAALKLFTYALWCFPWWSSMTLADTAGSSAPASYGRSGSTAGPEKPIAAAAVAALAAPRRPPRPTLLAAAAARPPAPHLAPDTHAIAAAAVPSCERVSMMPNDN